MKPLHLLLLIIGSVSLMSITNAEQQSIFKYKRVSETLAISGQPEPEEFRLLKELGVTTIINLRPPSEEPGFDQQALMDNLEFKYVVIPISTAIDLNRENVEALDEALGTAGNDSVLLHCASANRVGALMALRANWLQGKSSKESIAIGLEHGMTNLEPTIAELLGD